MANSFPPFPHTQLLGRVYVLPEGFEGHGGQEIIIPSVCWCQVYTLYIFVWVSTLHVHVHECAYPIFRCDTKIMIQVIFIYHCTKFCICH